MTASVARTGRLIVMAPRAYRLRARWLVPISSPPIENAILTVEEHQIRGGLGDAVAQAVVRHHPVPMDILGMDDEFGQSGTANELLAHYGLALHCLLNKSDTLGNSAGSKVLRDVRELLDGAGVDASVQLFSALRGSEADQCAAVVEDWLAAAQTAVE